MEPAAALKERLPSVCTTPALVCVDKSAKHAQDQRLPRTVTTATFTTCLVA